MDRSSFGSVIFGRSRCCRIPLRNVNLWNVDLNSLTIRTIPTCGTPKITKTPLTPRHHQSPTPLRTTRQLPKRHPILLIPNPHQYQTPPHPLRSRKLHRQPIITRPLLKPILPPTLHQNPNRPTHKPPNLLLRRPGRDLRQPLGPFLLLLRAHRITPLIRWCPKPR